MALKSNLFLALMSIAALVSTGCNKFGSTQAGAEAQATATCPPPSTDPVNPTDRARYSDSKGTAITMTVLPQCGPIVFWLAKPGLPVASGSWKKGGTASNNTMIFNVTSNGLNCNLKVTTEFRGNSISAAVLDPASDAACKPYEVVYIPPAAGKTTLPLEDLRLCQGSCSK